jgi:hypothetical protein
MGKLLKRLVKPKSVIGKVVGAAGSLLGIGGGGAALGMDIEFAFLGGLAVAGGYVFGWSLEQVKGFISFLNKESGKRKD